MPGPADQDPDLALQALLADLKHTAPTPDDVTARLDATLAGLRDEPVAPAVRRPWGRRLVLAAAAVAAVALVATPVVRSVTDSPTSTVAGSSAANASPEASREPLATAPSDAPPTTPRDTTGLVELRSSSFAADVEQQLPALTRTGARDTSAAPCGGPAPSSGLLVSRTVLLDGAPVRLEVVEGTEGAARAVAYSCDGGAVVSRATITAPTSGNSHGPGPQE